MHIAHFIQRYPPALGGSESYFERLGSHLTRSGHDVTVWCSSAVSLDEMWSNSRNSPPQISGPVKRFRPCSFPARRYILKALSLVPHRPLQCLTSPCNPICPAMWHEAGRFTGPLDAVHATAFPYSFPIACGLRLARRRGVPFFLTPFLHLADERSRRQYTAPHLRWLLNQADRIFVQTRLERDAVRSLGISHERIVLQGLGVEPSECTGGTRTHSAEPVVGHLANASAEKGTIDLLRAAAVLWEQGARFRVHLAGPAMPSFERFWNSYPHQEQVTRLGPISEREKQDFFASLDVFALPSHSDSFGLVLLEAWANGVPNLVYAAGGPGEIVRDGFDGLHAAYGNVKHLAEQLQRLIVDTDLRKRLGAIGRERLTSEFNWPDKLEIVHNELLGFKNRSAFFAGGSRGIPDRRRPPTVPTAHPIPNAEW